MAGVRAVDFYGNFFMNNTTDVQLACVDPDTVIHLVQWAVEMLIFMLHSLWQWTSNMMTNWMREMGPTFRYCSTIHLELVPIVRLLGDISIT